MSCSPVLRAQRPTFFIVQSALGQFKERPQESGIRAILVSKYLFPAEVHSSCERNARLPQSGHDFVLSKSFREWGEIPGGLTSPQHNRADICRSLGGWGKGVDGRGQSEI